MSYEIHHMFATPLLTHKNFLPQEYFYELIAYSLAEEYESIPNADGKVRATVSKNFLKKLPWLKEEIIETFKEYARNILRVDPSIDFKIGSSWVSLTDPGHESKDHTHANYYYSGCFYLSDDPSSIDFSLGSYIYNFHERFLFKYAEVNEYNSNRISYHGEKNEILFFPSHVKHRISKNTSDTPRYSLAFNIHPVGRYGMLDSSIHVDIIEDID